MKDVLIEKVLFGLVIAMLAATAPVAAGEDYAVREKGGPRPEAKPDQASVYIVRPANLGKAIRIWAFADDAVLGVTKGNTYTHVYLDPGTYIFWSKAENVSAVEFEVKAGKTYYFKQKAKMGGLKARVKVQFLPEDEGLEALDECEKFSTLTEAGKTKGATVSSKNYEKARKKVAKG